ncbi:MAG: TIGR03016 family PEP-CTERM system-associated outer membrane protein [Gammaproteobacteria bacterium]|nr:TIGR03016 family PEP-CTERM system-associated outer membrane protein [Gammaproteobacteria bacterium]
MCKIAALLVVAMFPTAVFAANWNIVPSVETALTYADNFTFAAKGHEEAETVLEVKPAISIQSTEGRTLVGLYYGIDNLFYANNPDRNAVQQLLRGNASSEVVRDLFFVNATGSIAYQAVKPTATADLGNLAISQDSTQVDTWSVSPYFRQTFSGAAELRVGMAFNVVNYKDLLPDSYSREYFFNAASGPSAQDLQWKFDIRSNEVYYRGQLSDAKHGQAELDLRYKVLPQWALTGRVGYVDYKYDTDPIVNDEPKGNTWRSGVAWIPSTRTELEAGVSKTFGSRAKYGSFTHQGQWLFWNANVEEVVTDRRQLQLAYTDPATQQQGTSITPYLTQTEEVFINKTTRLRTGYKSDEFTTEISAYRDHRLFQRTHGTETVSGASASMGVILSRNTSVQASVSQSKVNAVDSTQTEFNDVSASLLHSFGTGVKTSLSAQRRAGTSSDPFQSDFVAYLISARVLMSF